MTVATGVTVVGSVHMDLIATAAELPTLGMSVIGTSFTQSPGGKAGNQAAQLARLGVSTCLLAHVGEDALGDQIIADLAQTGFDVTLLSRSADLPTGASLVFGIGAEYASIIVPGAATCLRDVDLDRAATAFAHSRFLLAQLELGPEIARASFTRARASGALTVLNASPLSGGGVDSLYRLLRTTDVLVVNRHEAAKLAGQPVPDRSAAMDVAHGLGAQFGNAAVVVTCGSDGAVLARGGDQTVVDAFPVDVVDSVGAGDAFLGGLVAAWVDGCDDASALRYASATGALAASGAGAFRSLPDRSTVDSFLRARS
jgi:ribokinase